MNNNDNILNHSNIIKEIPFNTLKRIKSLKIELPFSTTYLNKENYNINIFYSNHSLPENLPPRVYPNIITDETLFSPIDCNIEYIEPNLKGYNIVEFDITT